MRGRWPPDTGRRECWASSRKHRPGSRDLATALRTRSLDYGAVLTLETTPDDVRPLTRDPLGQRGRSHLPTGPDALAEHLVTERVELRRTLRRQRALLLPALVSSPAASLEGSLPVNDLYGQRNY